MPHCAHISQNQNHLQLFIDRYYAFVVILGLIVTHHPRRPHQSHPPSVLSFVCAAVPISVFTFPFSQLLSFQSLARSFVVFCTHEKLKSFVLKCFRALSAKHPGWGDGGTSFQPKTIFSCFAPLCFLLSNHPFVFKRLRTLPSSVSHKPFVCHSYENTGGVGVFFPFWYSPLRHLVTSLRPYFTPSSSLFTRSFTS